MAMPQQRYQVKPSFTSALVGILAFGLVVYLLVRVAAFTFKALFAGLPIFFGIGVVLAVVAYFIDRRVPMGLVRSLGLTFREHPVKGIVMSAATVLFAPFVGAYLLLKALFMKRMREMVSDFRERAQGGIPSAGPGAMDRPDAAFRQNTTRASARYREVHRPDGLVIRIPVEEEQP